MLTGNINSKEFKKKKRANELTPAFCFGVVNKENLTRAGFELTTPGALLTELSIALCWRSLYFVNIFVWGAIKKPYII